MSPSQTDRCPPLPRASKVLPARSLMDVLPFTYCVRTLVGRTTGDQSDCNEPARAPLFMFGVRVRIHRCNLIVGRCFGERTVPNRRDAHGRIVSKTECDNAIGAVACVTSGSPAVNNNPVRAAITSVMIHRAEGRPAECIRRTFTGSSALALANVELSRWARTAPDSRACDKCDFTVTWDDGEEYRGRFDMQRRHIGGGNLLGDQMKRFLGTIAGTFTPAHLANENGARYLIETYSAEDRAEAALMLSTRTFE